MRALLLSVLLSGLLFPICLIAQKEISRDTSFTVYSSFIKESKKHPFIKIVKPEFTKGIHFNTDIIYVSYGDRSLSLDIFHPAKKNKKGYPGVLLIHGGGWKSGDRSQNIPFAQQLAQRGYVAVTAEYRLSPEAQYPAAVEDLKAAIRWMKTHASSYPLDTARIAVLGFSAGGQLAALLGTTYSNSIQAIVDIDGILAFKHPESAEGATAALWLGGTYEELPQVWTEASALNHISKSTPPALFINSSLPRFHAGRDDMIKKMDSLSIYSEVHTLPDTPHPFWLFHPWFKPTIDYTAGFLDKILK